MPIGRLLHSACGASVLAILVGAFGCSSDSITRPFTSQNARLIAHFDSLRNETTDPDREAALLDIIQMLAEGAPVSAGTIWVNGTPAPVAMVGELNVKDISGIPADSDYLVGTWTGDGTDSVIAFIETQGLAVVRVGTLNASGQDVEADAQTLTLGAIGADCTSFLDVTPVDVFAPVPLNCQRQTATASFGVLTVKQTAYVLPRQDIAGIRLEAEVAP